MRMSNSRLSFLIVITMLMICPCTLEAQKLVENHIEVMEQFSRVQSKSKSLVGYAKRRMTGQPALDTVELMYMDLKEATDASMAKYKTIIDNPNLAKKTEASITENLNEMLRDLEIMQNFISSKASASLGFQQQSVFGLITGFTGLSGGLIKEISSMQRGKKDAVKAEIDQYKLTEWEDI
jgi:hypothetical protein